MANFKVDAYNQDRSEIESQFSLTPTDSTSGQLVGRNEVSPLGTITAGALPTQQLVSGTGAQVSTTREVQTYTPITTTTAAGTATVALSPDNTTYSTLYVLTPTVNAAIFPVAVRVPAGWYIKITVSNATIGVTTYA